MFLHEILSILIKISFYLEIINFINWIIEENINLLLLELSENSFEDNIKEYIYFIHINENNKIIKEFKVFK
jgi:hypothetical protein